MRALLCGCVAVALLASCASDHAPSRSQPPAPQHPLIKGAVNNVSSSDIRHIVQFMSKHIVKEHGSLVPIYSIDIDDGNHATVWWWDNGVETTTPIARVHRKWQLSPTAVERVVRTGTP